jgi:hypothetical protein
MKEDALKQSTIPDDAAELPNFPQADDRGYYPAVEYALGEFGEKDYS